MSFKSSSLFVRLQRQSLYKGINIYNTKQSSSLLLFKRNYVSSFRKAGIELARLRLTLRPMTGMEAGRQSNTLPGYFGLIFFQWWFTGLFIFNLLPFYWCMPWMGDFIRSFMYWTLELGYDTYRDPLIPPPNVWNEQHLRWKKELEIRKARFEKAKERYQN
mmetsp:Transcript_84510/g.103570  ORF Transcript_84510/g.103570 Transcript_84510/m.103570 type:complete len:161 (-) Transcript_84510:59-541(-)